MAQEIPTNLIRDCLFSVRGLKANPSEYLECFDAFGKKFSNKNPDTRNLKARFTLVVADIWVLDRALSEDAKVTVSAVSKNCDSYLFKKEY